MVTANEVQDQLMVVHVLYPLPFDLTLGTFQLLVVTANEVQDQLMVVHVLYPLPFDLT